MAARILADEPLPLSEVQKDLAAITRTALQKEPLQRYESVGHLRDDVERFLDGLPVRAHAYSVGALMKNFLMRHRIPFAAGGAFLLLLVAAVASVVFQARKAQRSGEQLRQLAVKDLEEAAIEMWRIPKTVQRVVQLRQKRVDLMRRLLQDEPSSVQLKRELLSALLYSGISLGHPNSVNLGRSAEARKQFEAALSLAEEIYVEAPKDPRSIVDLVVVLSYMAASEEDLGRAGGVRAFRERAFNLVESYAKSGEKQTTESKEARAIAISEMGRVLASEGRAAPALERHATAISLRSELLESSHALRDQLRLTRGLSIALANAAESFMALGVFDRAEENIDYAIGVERQLLANNLRHIETHWMLAERLRLKGAIELKTGRPKNAVSLLREAVDLYRGDFRDDSENYRNLRGLVAGLGELTAALESMGSLTEALATVREGTDLASQAAERNRNSVEAQRDLSRMLELRKCLEARTTSAQAVIPCSTATGKLH